MIEKMKFLSITGPKADIDRVVDTYLSRYEIHLENALSELKTVKDLRPYIETNPYKEKKLCRNRSHEPLPHKSCSGFQAVNISKIPSYSFFISPSLFHSANTGYESHFPVHPVVCFADPSR